MFEAQNLYSLVAADNEPVRDIYEFIEALPLSERCICSALIIDGIPKDEVARQMGIGPRRVVKIAREAMGPLARSFGIRKARRK